VRSPESPAVQDLLRYVSMSVVAVAHDLPWKSGVGGALAGEGQRSGRRSGLRKLGCWWLVVVAWFRLPPTYACGSYS